MRTLATLTAEMRQGTAVSSRGEALMTEGFPPARPTSYDKKVDLVLQGGGALGSYQAGVYESVAS